MNFDLTEEQQILIDSVERFIGDRYTLEARQKYATGKQGFDAENWATMAELGWLALTAPEAHGGFGGSANSATAASEAMAMQARPRSSCRAAAMLITRAATTSARAQLLIAADTTAPVTSSE